MRSVLFAVVWCLLLVVPAFAAEPAPAGPTDGQPAPAFRLQDQKGKWHTLDQYQGHWLVLYFYPKDFTPGCTKQVCAFRDDIAQLRKAGADVLGVSLDDVKSHAEFAEKHKVPFPLLADVDKAAARSYGVLGERMGLSYARRETFLIDPHGQVARRYVDVDPEQNVKDVLADLDRLKTAAAPTAG
ncbi:peroxiredoxin [Dokdonella koreensis]|uniref:thioredoxin-dependent peroxiredoxin n=1 Tax=Dokdonella koreensis DS-123 TaxID=1300342 RepID=A0A167G6J4_9GAMM|nr:peroxiredoxin [Dokdonella koreensis]ANB16208.1 Alkyl hydroperoxide reductase/ Thiol specific antioxidant/ Mal allergen [Dokdonella koreensis DS-123]